MATAVQERIEDLKRAWSEVATDERLRTARRALADARHASEDALIDAKLSIRRRPLAAVGGAAGLGLALGAVFGFAAGYFMRRRWGADQ